MFTSFKSKCVQGYETTLTFPEKKCKMQFKELQNRLCQRKQSLKNTNDCNNSLKQNGSLFKILVAKITLFGFHSDLTLSFTAFFQAIQNLKSLKKNFCRIKFSPCAIKEENIWKEEHILKLLIIVNQDLPFLILSFNFVPGLIIFTM